VIGEYREEGGVGDDDGFLVEERKQRVGTSKKKV
jgi:hypothetical protein